MKNKDKSRITRREFYRIAGVFGLTSTLLGWNGLSKLGSAISAEALAEKTCSVSKARYRKKPRFNLKFGAAHFTKAGLMIFPNGSIPFVNDLEERTDGEIRIEYIGDNRLCRELDCTKMCINNEIDFFSASTQNASAAAPYLNILDFAYLWPSRASQYYFFYHPKSEPLLREPLRKFHNIQFLFTHCELRGVMMGLKYKDRPGIMTVEDLKGAKLRVAGSQLGRLALKLLGTEPLLVPWADCTKALGIGLIDGAETWSSAVAYGGWGPVVSQDVQCSLFSGNGMSSMSLKTFEKLGGRLQQAVMESAYLTQINVQKTSEAKLVTVTGINDPPLKGSYYHKYGIRNCIWSTEALDTAEQLTSPKYNPGPWKKWRSHLNRMVNGLDIFNELSEIARETPKEIIALDVEPRRWWKG